MAHTVVIDEWAIDDDNDFNVSLIEYRGRWGVDARIWFRAEDGELRPGRGLRLSVRHLERLAAAIEKARRGAVTRYLIETKELIEADGP